MAQTLRDCIKEITRQHLQQGNKIYGQCLTAVGWVGGTIPELTEMDGIVELSMADVAGGGIVVGAALAGIRPIYVVRYQGFQWFNSPIITNYAGKSREMWDIPCPIFIRSIAMEGGIGPVAGSSHHGIYLRMPGVKIASPMTPREYMDVYRTFMAGDVPVYVSEHRKSYNETREAVNFYEETPDITLFPFSITRLEAERARQYFEANNRAKVSLSHQVWISPFLPSSKSIESLKRSRFGVVLDDDYPNGAAKQIAYELMHITGKPVHVLCIKEKTAGFQAHNDNLPPTAEEIIQFISSKL